MEQSKKPEIKNWLSKITPKKWVVNVAGLILILLLIVNRIIFNPCNYKYSKIFYGVNLVLIYIAIAAFVIGVILGIYYVIKKEKGAFALQLIIWGIFLLLVAASLAANIYNCPNQPV